MATPPSRPIAEVTQLSKRSIRFETLQLYMHAIETGNSGICVKRCTRLNRAVMIRLQKLLRRTTRAMALLALP